jgi:hypothetical protein
LRPCNRSRAKSDMSKIGKASRPNPCRPARPSVQGRCARSVVESVQPGGCDKGAAQWQVCHTRSCVSSKAITRRPLLQGINMDCARSPEIYNIHERRAGIHSFSLPIARAGPNRATFFSEPKLMVPRCRKLGKNMPAVHACRNDPPPGSQRHFKFQKHHHLEHSQGSILYYYS